MRPLLGRPILSEDRGAETPGLVSVECMLFQNCMGCCCMEQHELLPTAPSSARLTRLPTATARALPPHTSFEAILAAG